MKELDIVLLNDGRQGTILEVYEHGKAYLLEITDDMGKTIETPTIGKEDIKETVYTVNDTTSQKWQVVFLCSIAPAQRRG